MVLNLTVLISELLIDDASCYFPSKVFKIYCFNTAPILNNDDCFSGALQVCM